MIEQDTIKLLRECDAGVRMGIVSIQEVADHAKSPDLRNMLNRSVTEHETLKTELRDLLNRYGDQGKAPNPIGRGMSWLKTNMMLGMNDSDQTIAREMTDGCNMGVKSLSRYLNQYPAADEASKGIANRLIGLESDLATNLRPYL